MKPFGDGLHGVDIKMTNHGPVIMEVNDNPDLYTGIEVQSDSVWEKIVDWFLERRRRKPRDMGVSLKA